MKHEWHHGFPPLAGLCRMQEALKPGMSVEECVRRLKRFHYAFARLHGLLTARITSVPYYELKTGFAHHAYLCAEHAAAIRQRVAELREPPLGLEEVPHPALKIYFDEIECAPTPIEFLHGVYGSAMPGLMEACHQYREQTHPIADAPTLRWLRLALLELKDMHDFGAFACGTPHVDRSEAFMALIASFLHAAGGLDGRLPCNDSLPEPVYSKHRSYDAIPQRDERFQDLWNQGVNAEAFLYSEEFPAKAKALMMCYKRMREIDVPEMMARIITETLGKPWAYYRDMSRQLWDEARHAMLGEVGFTALGVDWTEARITHNWSHRLNTECTPLEAHAVLFFIEQGLMPKTGKRYEFEVARESGIPIMATIQDFDWADEVLHSQIGRQWLVPEFGSLQAAMDHGDAAWSKILSNWATVRDNGLTQHENWWPRIYEQACAAAGEPPDPAALAFAETYEGKRADVHRGIE